MNSSLPRRLGAIAYDSLLVFALMFLASLPFVAVRGGEPVEAGDPVYRLVMLAVAYVFFTAFWVRAGRTLGMQSWGLRLETNGGDKPGLTRASLRFVAAMLSWLPAGLGFWWQLWDKEGLCWHDRLSRTRLRFYPQHPPAPASSEPVQRKHRDGE
ncbi:MAG: RDD family protein [Woeseia sp.]